MISHLKNTFELVYSVPLPESYRPQYNITPITEPYPYTDAKVSVTMFDNPTQSVKVKVYNAGGGRLHVERISIPHSYSKWVKRADKSKASTLTSTSDPHEYELELLLNYLPNPTNVNVAELKLISKPQRKTFSDITLEVHPPEERSAKLVVPEYINFGEITACKVSIADHRDDESKPPVDFFLIGDFTGNPPTSLEITQRDGNLFDTMMRFTLGTRYYRLDLRNPGVVKPRLKPKSSEINHRSVQQSFQISNVNRNGFSGQVATSDLDWLDFPTQINVAGYRTVNLLMSVKVDKLKQGRNFVELSISDKTVPVWAWFKTVNETTVTLDSDQPDFYHIEEFTEHARPLSLDIVSAEQSCPTLMIFDDLDFQFPFAADDQIGYLMGDFNKWTPRTFFLDKREDSFCATLSIPEGTYLYRAEIDGEMRLDPTRLNEIVCCSHGIASKIQVNRVEQVLTIGKWTKQKLNVKLQSSAKWMQIEPDEIVLTGSRKQEITLLFRPEYLQPGLNLGWIQCETTEEPTRSFHSPIYVMGRTNGAVPRLKDPELTFPQIEQGQVEEIPFVLNIIGEGELKGEVQPSTVLRFAEGNIHVQSETAYEQMAYTSALQVISDKPSNAYRKQIRASLITDCYLANLRVLPFVARYDMVHLVANPPTLCFPKIYLFDEPCQKGISIKRSDDRGDVACSVEIPDELSESNFLKNIDFLAGDDTGHCKLIINPQARIDTGRVSAIIKFHDDKSGMLLPIQFRAEIVGSEAKIEVDSHKHRSNSIPLTITNVGKTELRIFEVRFKRKQFHVFPHFTSQQRTVHPGESVERTIQPNKTINFLGRKVKDTLVIRLNDPQYPNGVFEKEIEAVTRGRFLNFSP